jgi:transposase
VLSLPTSLRIFVATKPVDFRKAHDGLCQVVRGALELDPLSGDVFVFTNKRRNRVKLLLWDRNGLWLFYKRLEKGTFGWLTSPSSSRVEIDRARLSMLLDGFDVTSARVHAHHVRQVCIRERSGPGDFASPPQAERSASHASR